MTQRPATFDRPTALVLQGGGALGSYQGGAYAALHAAGYLPHWVAGISIGAINAALIAGNAPARRVERLRAFWEEITAPSAFWPMAEGMFADALRQAGSAAAVLFGQPGFFAPQPALAWLGSAAPVSFYDTAALRGTLERLVDFDRIAAAETRLSVGAVQVKTGNFKYFDNTERDRRIGPEHIMASGALPPGFPPVEIDGEPYWDGGLVSNTPLQHVLDAVPRRSMLAFQVDLFPARGKPPTTLLEVSEREKDIRYSSRTRAGTDQFGEMQTVRVQVTRLLEKLPAALRNAPEAAFLREIACTAQMDVVQLIYRAMEPEGGAKDFEFSRATMEARWMHGMADVETALRASPWLLPAAVGVGMRSFDLTRGDKREGAAAGRAAARGG